MQIVEVIWWDAAFEDEYSTRDAWSLSPVELHTVGYLSAETDEALVLSMTICKEDNKVVTEQMIIPWEMIIEWGDLSSHV